MDEQADDDPTPGVPWERNFREQMVRLRKERGLTQTDLARLLAAWGLAFHQQTVQRIENGQRPLRLNEAKLIARELGASLDTMTSTASASGQAMMRAVDEARAAADKFADSVNEELEELGAAVSDLVLLVGELLEGTNSDSAADPVLIYGFTWANHLWDLYVHAAEAMTKAAEVHGGREINGGLSRPEFEVMNGWFDQFDYLFDPKSGLFPPFPERDDSAT